MQKLMLTALSLSMLSAAAFAAGGANASANWERSRNPAALAASSQVAPQSVSSQAQAPAAASREAREAFEAQVIQANRANYRGR